MARFRKAEKLEDVRGIIDEMLDYWKAQNSPLGYFAALYTKVAKAIEQHVIDKEFDNNERLAQMDVNFVNYYIDAMNCAVDGSPAPVHWQVVIDASKEPKYLVLEYLLISMNAHINYDLCNAVHDTVDSNEIMDFKNDFMKVNKILFDLLDIVQDDVSNIFHPLKWYLQFGRKMDDSIISVIMGQMRNDAFGFATTLAVCNEVHYLRENKEKKQEVLELSNKIVFHKQWWINAVIRLIRLFEIGSVKSKTDQLLK